MLIGVIWATLAPLILVAAIVATRLALRRAGAARALPLAIALVLIPVAAVYALDRAAFAKVCTEIGPPRIARRAVADGVYLNSPTANSFGMRYLHDEGFLWLERRDSYDRKGFVRVARNAAGGFDETKIDAVSARYEVIEGSETVRGHDVHITRVVDRRMGDEMARAGDAYFMGGHMAFVLGAWGASSCHSAHSDPASFRAYHHLARDTLRP